MAKKDTKKAVTEEAQRMLRIESGRANLLQRDLPFPGGDECPSAVVRGLGEIVLLLRELHDMHAWNRSDDEQMAMQWLELWVDAGAAMLPRETPQRRAAPPAARRIAMPKDWSPTEDARTRARVLGLDADEEADDFREWTTAKGMKYVGQRGWDAAFLNHMRSRARWRKEREDRFQGQRSLRDWDKQKSAERLEGYRNVYALFKDDDGEEKVIL